MQFLIRTNCLIYFFCISFSLFAEEPANDKQKEGRETKPASQEIRDRRIQIQNDSIIEPPSEPLPPNPPKDFSLKKDNGAKYFTFYPGVQANLSDLKIVSSTAGRAVMVDDQRMDQNLSFLYDLKSHEWQVGENWGLFILNRNVNFRQSKQKITDITETNMASEGESGSSNRSSPITKRIQDFFYDS